MPGARNDAQRRSPQALEGWAGSPSQLAVRSAGLEWLVRVASTPDGAVHLRDAGAPEQLASIVETEDAYEVRFSAGADACGVHRPRAPPLTLDCRYASPVSS